MSMFDVLFALIWIVVGFFVLRYAAQRFFAQPELAGKYQSEVLAGGIVAAFVIGALFASRNQPAVQTASVQSTTTATATPGFICHTPSPPAKIIRGIKKAQGGKYQGHIDSVRPELESNRSAAELPASCNIYANGWVVDTNLKSPAAGIGFLIDSKTVVNATSAYGRARPDIVSAFSAPGMLHSGFLDAEIPTAGLRKGTHTFQLVALSKDGKRYYPAGDSATVTLR